MTKQPTIHCIMDSAHGIYIPQNFAEEYLTDLRQWSGVSKDDRATLLVGPDHESYWDAWCNVLDNAEHKTTGSTLYQDGDLFIIEPFAIGDPEDVVDVIKEAATVAMERCKQALSAADWSLHHGSNSGGVSMSFEDALQTIRDTIESVADSVNLPPYIWSDFGPWEECTVDVESEIRTHLSGYYRELMEYV
jgi:hypothetical protein